MSAFIDNRHILSIARSNFNLPSHNLSKKPFGFNYRSIISIYHPKKPSDFNLPFKKVQCFNLPSKISIYHSKRYCDFNLPSDNFNLLIHYQSCDFNLPSDNFNLAWHCQLCDFNLPSDNFNLPWHCELWDDITNLVVNWNLGREIEMSRMVNWNNVGR